MGMAARVLQRLGLSGEAALAFEDAFGKIYTIDMVDAGNVGSGGTTRAGVGFQVKDFKGDDAEEAFVLGFGAYDDEELATAAANATLDTASAGTILSGGGSNTLEVVTDSSGAFACTLTDTSD